MRKIGFLACLFCLMVSGNLAARERHGAELTVIPKNGPEVKGELISVRVNSILLLDAASAIDVSIAVADISLIRIKTKSRVLSDTLWGALIGGGAGFVIGMAMGDDKSHIVSFTAGQKGLIGGSIGVGLGGLIGLTLGALAGTEKTYEFAGKSDSEIKAILVDLSPRSRVR